MSSETGHRLGTTGLGTVIPGHSSVLRLAPMSLPGSEYLEHENDGSVTEETGVLAAGVRDEARPQTVEARGSSVAAARWLAWAKDMMVSRRRDPWRISSATLRTPAKIRCSNR